MWILKKIKIADFFTLGNGICGFLAMLSLRERWGEKLGGDNPFFLPAISLIILGMILDGLDGAIARWEARKFGQKNNIGHYLDSISDMVTFCFAPAFMLYTVYRYPWLEASGSQLFTNVIIVLASLIVASFGILRLARFVSSAYKKDIFLGLPTPPNAFIICILCFLFPGYWYITVPISIILAFLMISEIHYPKIMGKARIIFGILVLLFVISIVLMILNIGTTLTKAELFGYNISAIVALGVALFYSMGIPIMKKFRNKQYDYDPLE